MLKTRNEAKLLFQTLDNKKECYAVYSAGDLYHYSNDLELTHTWDYTPHFDHLPIEYAQVWTEGKSLGEVCPAHLKDEWDKIESRARAYLTSFRQAKVNLQDVCFYDMVPQKFLLKYCETKNKISDYVFEHFKKPNNYEFLLDLLCLTQHLEKQKLNIHVENLDFINPRNRKVLNKIKTSSNYIKYNPWGTVTGRLTTKSESFPILTLNKEIRNVLWPTNDLFVEMDYNAAEIRALFALLGREQPSEDIHAWIAKHVFDQKYSREETKTKIFAWLYNPRAENKKLSKYIDKKQILKRFYHDGVVTTPYGRKMQVEEKKALNYLVQSTAADIFLRATIKIHKLLKDYNSNIAFCIHDSLVIDICKEEKAIIKPMLKLFADTQYGDFKYNLNMGKNFGSMRKVI